MRTLKRAIAGALLLAALAARGEEPPADAPPARSLEFQATLYQTDAKKFLEAIGPKDGASIPAVFDRASSRGLSAALADAKRLNTARKTAPPGKPAVLEAVEQRKYVRDADVDFQDGKALATPIESLFQWGFKAEITSLAAAEGRLTARIEFQFAGPLKSKFLDHLGVRVEMPSLSTFAGKTLAVFPPGGSLAFGCVASQEPETLLVLVIGLSPDGPPPEVPDGKPELAGLPAFSTAVWLLVNDRAALSKAEGEAKGAELTPAAAAKLRAAGKLQSFAFLPVSPSGRSELHFLGQETFVRGWDKDEVPGASAWSPVVGRMETGLRWTGGEAAPSKDAKGFDFPFELRACVLRQPVRTKAAEKGSPPVPAPEFLEGGAKGALSTGAAERCFLFKASGAGCPYAATVLASVRPELPGLPAAPAGPPKPPAASGPHAEALNKAEIVVIGECLGYYPREHLAGMECECLIGGIGRLPVRVDEVLKGAELAGEARKLFDLIGALRGHAAHELPELRKACEDKTFLLLRAGKIEGGLEGLAKTDASFKGKKGIWCLRLGHEKKSLEQIRASGRLDPDVLADWIFEWEFLDASEEAKVREALGAGKR
ncbi:MAG: hypothetical protein MUC63_07160 [Planctomycetes bacterium]|nr:hypothetical protein [Planctomycetota bacterium]